MCGLLLLAERRGIVCGGRLGAAAGGFSYPRGHAATGKQRERSQWLWWLSLPSVPLACAASCLASFQAGFQLPQPLPSTEGSLPGKCDVGPAKRSPLRYELWKTGVG